MPASIEARVLVAVGRGQQRHYQRDETTTVCGKTGVLRVLDWAMKEKVDATCRGCNGVAATIRRFR